MSQRVELKVPDIGNYKNVDVIEVLVKPGDTIAAEMPLVTLETDKATMEVPASVGGVVKEVKVKLGDKVSQDSILVLLETTDSAAPTPVAASPTPAAPQAREAGGGPSVSAPALPLPAPALSPTTASMTQPAGAAVDPTAFKAAHASPAVRKFARELGVDLARVSPTGPKGRILDNDVRQFVKGVISSGGTGTGTSPGGGLNLLPWPQIDFAQFGPVERKPLSRIKKLSGANLARNWAMIPHVTQFDEADITEMEAFRKQMSEELKKQDIKLTPLAFLIKASVAALRKYPEFNASLEGDNLVLKGYCHIGFAADTPNGLVVPVIRNADQKSLIQLAQESSTLAAKAREGKLTPVDMQGGCFSISSLGGIGGTAFTPIINAPEVAILGVSKSTLRPYWDGKVFVPRLMLPLSLSYDHRVIDGAAAARFTSTLALLLSDIRRFTL